MHLKIFLFKWNVLLVIGINVAWHWALSEAHGTYKKRSAKPKLNAHF